MSTEPQKAPDAKSAADPKAMKPYVRLAATLVMTGAGIFGLERFGLGEVKTFFGGRIDPTILSILVIVPMVMIIGGGLVFLIGRMRRL
jgi:TM2 domain-containing membrane protein YozV